MPITIGITATESNYEKYPLWIKDNDSTINTIQLLSPDIDSLKCCNGVVLSGGVDTHPSFYNNKRLKYPLAPQKFDEERDRYELRIFDYCLHNNIPVLAICRGMQLVNIALGGDMIQDIEETGRKSHRRIADKDSTHKIKVESGSLLYTITKKTQGVVNSAHHQALGSIAPDLSVTAASPDGVAECIEWKSPTNRTFLLGVQWHPERLADNPFSENIREYFLKAAKILIS